MRYINLFILCMAAFFFACSQKEIPGRQVMRLDGAWEIVKTAGELPTGVYTSTIPVPGLVDLAVPALFIQDIINM